MENLNTLITCLSAIEEWMSSNFLQLNASKTEVLILAADSIASKVASHLGSFSEIMTTATSPILLKWDPKSLEIRTLTVERLLEPLVTQDVFIKLLHAGYD
ncbi:hypothetical protein NQZ68_035840 [Dissostichus eleginoides]|nr:hypothetical protein NQZ68_035840 [Dissostichus eleginoides]